MKTIEYFESVGKRGFYRPTATVSYDLAVQMVGEAMRHARSLGLESLLVNTNGLTGFSPPSIFDRHALAVKWAEAVGASLRVAIVARPELIDPEKIGVVMAQNRGVSGDVFATEPAALAWLDTWHRNTEQ
jgi:hypothetical protein